MYTHVHVHMHEPCKRQSHLDRYQVENYIYNNIIVIDVSYHFVKVRMIEHGREISLITLQSYMYMYMYMYYALLLYNV